MLGADTHFSTWPSGLFSLAPSESSRSFVLRVLFAHSDWFWVFFFFLLLPLFLLQMASSLSFCLEWSPLII